MDTKYMITSTYGGQKFEKYNLVFQPQVKN